MRWVRLLTANRRLRVENKRLLVALAISNQTTARVAYRCQQLQRDADLLGLMARDRSVALEFVRDSHRIDQLPEGRV